ncbi:zinc finger protein [Trichonephila clavipes]|nr:zinc finger protein [Trichonephila clavipes]
MLWRGRTGRASFSNKLLGGGEGSRQHRRFVSPPFCPCGRWRGGEGTAAGFFASWFFGGRGSTALFFTRKTIEAEGFKVAKISQLKNYTTKAPMPLFYLQIENGVDAPKIYDFTELFGTRIEVKPFERGNKINQCWRCQGWFHSSEVCHLPPSCVKCAGPHMAKDCTLDFNDPMKCANCSGAHAANWSRCPKHPNNAKKKAQNKNKNGPKPKNVQPNKKTTPQVPRPDISKARKVSPLIWTTLK